MTFQRWSKTCGAKDGIYCWMSNPHMACEESDCPRLDEYIADLEASEYSAHLEDKLDRERERQVGV